VAFSIQYLPISLKHWVKYYFFGCRKHKKPFGNRTSSGFSCVAFGAPLVTIWKKGRWRNDTVKEWIRKGKERTSDDGSHHIWFSRNWNGGHPVHHSNSCWTIYDNYRRRRSSFSFPIHSWLMGWIRILHMPNDSISAEICKPVATEHWCARQSTWKNSTVTTLLPFNGCSSGEPQLTFLGSSICSRRECLGLVEWFVTGRISTCRHLGFFKF